MSSLLAQRSIFILLISLFALVKTQWELFTTNNEGPTARKGHSLTTWIGGADFLTNRTNAVSNEILVLFGGRSQAFAYCVWPDGWDNETCGDHFDASLVDTSIVLSSISPSYPSCATNCSNNGWCNYDETLPDSYCICYDDYRGELCQYKEFQVMEYDIWLLDVETLLWTQYDFVQRNDFAYANQWPWPSGRLHHTAVMNPLTNELILYGGVSEKCVDYCNDLWFLNLTNINTPTQNAWREIIDPNSTAPNNEVGTAGERWHHQSWFSYDPQTNKSFLYILGGHRHLQFLDDLVQFDLETYTWEHVDDGRSVWTSDGNFTSTTMQPDDTSNYTIPPTRIGAASTFITDYTAHEQNFGFIHGGYHSPDELNADYEGMFPKNDTYWLRDLWSVRVETSNGNPRVVYKNITYEGLGEFYTYEYPIYVECEDGTYNCTNGTWTIEIEDEILAGLNTWYAIPYPRYAHKIHHVDNTDILFLFGGYISHQFMNDTWRFNLTSQRWIRHNPPKIWDLDTSTYYVDTRLANITNLTAHDFTISEMLTLMNKSGVATNITTVELLVTNSYEIYAIDSNVTDPKYLLAPRSDFAISFVPSLNSLILFGGVGSDRTLFDYDLGYDTHHIFFNDTYIMRFDECLGPTLEETSDPCNENTGKGSCFLQYCFCEPGYWGNACQNIMCPNSTCTYDLHTWLPTCEFCSNHGVCRADGTCECVDGYRGDACEELACPDDCTASDRGVCVEVEWGDIECSCYSNFTGDSCEDRTCSFDCFGRGTCDPETGECTCESATETGRVFSPDHFCAFTVLEGDSVSFHDVAELSLVVISMCVWILLLN